MWLISLRLRTRREPDKTAVCIVGLFILFLLLPVIVVGPLDVTGGTGTFDFDLLTRGLPWQVLLSGILLAIVAFIAWWDIVKLSSKIDRIGLRPLYAVLLYPVAGIVTFTLVLLNDGSAEAAFEILLFALLLNFFVGFAEEILFRGILFGGLRQKSRLITAIAVSSIAFGLMHFINAGVGQSLPETLFQMLNASALGVLFCGLVLQGNSLWPAVLLHMVWNAYAMIGIASAERLGGVSASQTDATTLSASSLILPALICIIAFAVLQNYTKRTGTRLRDVVPVAS